MADEATETPTTNAADEARAQAEARRRRILEQAQTRMGVVSGEVTQDEEEKQQSASKAARIRAARARRYGKKSTASATATTEDDSAAPASETPEEPKEETPVTNDQPPKPEPTPAPVVADYDDDDVPADEKAADTASSVAASQASDDTGTKKKYLGVAKMRRKMIQKKKMEEAEETPKDAVTDAKETPMAPPTASVAFSPIPIYMHFFTLLLLFLAGLDVGFQQYHPNVQVHTQFVVAQHGLPLVHRSLLPSKPKPVIVVPDEINLDEAAGDEFEEPDAEEIIPNIDPIFRVDLDQLTQGPGFFNQIARGAVGVHRAILALFALPLTIFQSVVGMPQALLRFPPILCVLALIIRQLIGKMLLGASIPETEIKSKGGTDVLEMVKNFVNGLLKSTFPTFVGMYDAFSHLKSDMYVILFGVFCGFIMGHWQPAIPASGTDEL